jgi:hypothetical protein
MYIEKKKLAKLVAFFLAAACFAYDHLLRSDGSKWMYSSMGVFYTQYEMHARMARATHVMYYG